MPSKLRKMLYSPAAIIACAQLGTELDKTLSGCGVIVEPDNPIEFFNALVQLSNNRNLRNQYGLHGQAYAK